MNQVVALLLPILLTPVTGLAKSCLETYKVVAPSKEIIAISELQEKGWLPVQGKKVVTDLDQNGKEDFAYVLKNKDQLRVYVIWDGDRIMKAQCHSDLIDPTSVSAFTDDPCKLKFEKFKNNNEVGLLIRTDASFTYKYICRKFDADPTQRIWSNIGTPD